MAETYLNAREIWYTNMHLLGFRPSPCDDATLEKDTTLEKDMFIHINKKGSENVLHFLFSKLDPHCARESFRDCWHVHDKKQEQQFRRTCCDWIARIAKEDPLSRLPLMPASLLLSPGGNKFYLFLMRLSSYILRTLCLEEAKAVDESVFLSSFVASGKGFTKLKASQKQVAHYALQAIVRHSNGVQQRSQLTCALHKKWEEYANQLIRQYRELTKKCRGIAKKLLALEQDRKQRLLLGTCQDATACSGPDNESVLAAAIDVTDRQRYSRIIKVLEMWESLEKFVKSSEVHTEMVDCIVQGKVNQHAISAKDMTVQIPEVVAREYECLSREREVSNTYQDGKVNLLGLIQMQRCSLRLLKTGLVKDGSDGGITSFEEELDCTAGELQAHRAHLSAARNLRTSLSMLKASLEESIEEIESREDMPTTRSSYLVANGEIASSLETNAHTSSYTLPKFFVPDLTLPTLDLGLIPPTPIKKRQPVTPDAALSRLSLATNNVSTPFAVQDLSDIILQDSRLKQKKIGSSTRGGGFLGLKSGVGRGKLEFTSGTTGRASTLLNPSSTAHPRGTTPQSWDTSHSDATAPNFGVSRGKLEFTSGTAGRASTLLNPSSTAHPRGTTPQSWDTSHSDATAPNFGGAISELRRTSASTLDHLTTTRQPILTSGEPQLNGTIHSTPSAPQVSRPNYTTPTSMTSHLKGASRPTTTTIATRTSTEVATSAQQRSGGAGGNTAKSVPRAHEILADQIVAAVCWSESDNSFQSDEGLPGQLHSVTDTVAAMGADGFCSRDLIPRTPLPSSTNRPVNRRESMSELEMNSSCTPLGGGEREGKGRGRGDLEVASKLEPVSQALSYDAAGLMSWSGSDTSSLWLMSESDTSPLELVPGSDIGSNWLVSIDTP